MFAYIFSRPLYGFSGNVHAGCYLSEIEEETGVLASFGEVGEKHCDTDQEHR